MSATLEAIFPRLKSDGYKVTSVQDRTYNCIAWAAGDERRWWWPLGSYFWPAGIDRTVTLDAFVAAFATLGYVTCANGSVEAGYDKVAIYVDAAGRPTHAARQLGSGSWTSKLGRLEDVEHRSPSGVEGRSYGIVGAYLRRPAVESN